MIISIIYHTHGICQVLIHFNSFYTEFIDGIAFNSVWEHAQYTHHNALIHIDHHPPINNYARTVYHIRLI